MFAMTTQIDVEWEGQLIQFTRPRSKTLLTWQNRLDGFRQRMADSVAARLKDKVEPEPGEELDGQAVMTAFLSTLQQATQADMFDWEDVEWILQQLAEHWSGPIEVDGEERKVDASLLQDIFSPDHAYGVWLKLMQASKPDLEAEGLLGKSETQSTSASTSEETTTAENVKQGPGWRDFADTLSPEEKKKAGIQT